MVEFFLILGATVIYFTPLLVAAWVRHPQLTYIGGLNAVTGVTGIGWVGALIWALRRRKVIAVSYHGDMRVARSFNTDLLTVSGLLVGVAVIAFIAVNRVQTRGVYESATPLYVAEADSPAPSQWRHASADGVDTASLDSSNNLTLPPPFKGGQATLGIANDPHGPVVSLDIDGDMACAYVPSASSVLVSFDNGPAQAFACGRSPTDPGKPLFDGTHSTGYIVDSKTFVARLKTARRVTITGDFAGQGGAQAMVFDLPAGGPVLAAASSSAPVVAPAAAIAAAAVAVPAATAVAAASTPAVAGDQAEEGRHAHRRRHQRHSAHADETYVDGVPAHHHRRHRD